MNAQHESPIMNDDPRGQKILLVLLPFWTPQIPPLGIGCIKGYLQQHGYHHVKTVDANIELDLREGYYAYYRTLKGYVPLDKQGNYDSLVNDVWQNHMMAHLHYTDEGAYYNLVKILVYKDFFCHLTDDQVTRLNHTLDDFYRRLEIYFVNLLEREKPDVLGVSAFIGTLPASVFALKLTRERYPHIKTVIGGGAFYDQLGYGTENLEHFARQTEGYIDKIIVGEGEKLLLVFLEGEIPESQQLITRDDVGGEVLDLDSVDVPDISDFQLEYYPYVGLYASRSCPFQCRFCSDPVFWGKYRKKKAARIVDEMVKLQEKYHSQLFIMSDLLLNPVINDLARELIDRDLSLYWDSHMRVGEEVCSIENTMMWRRAGFYRTELGVESGSQRILDLMGKKITLDQIKRAVSALSYVGIKVTTYWVIGYPGETEEDFQMTLDLVEELKDDIYEAMSNAFWYYPEGQVNSGKWKYPQIPLYSVEARDMLILQHWLLDCEPSREERYRRVNRFVSHCKKLGIPDIYSLREIYEADERWKRLHKNAVPSMIEFKGKSSVIDENRRIKMVNLVENRVEDDGDWGF